MNKCPWENISNFQSIGELNRFIEWMDEQIALGLALKHSVDAPYVNASTLREKWYIHIQSGEIWRLVFPDGPFKGFFEKK